MAEVVATEMVDWEEEEVEVATGVLVETVLLLEEVAVVMVMEVYQEVVTGV